MIFFGVTPASTPLLSGSTFFVAGLNGGLVRVDTDGNNFSMVHPFAGGASDGQAPHDTPILIGSTLYGLTEIGGSSNHGVLYQINTNGTGFQILHTFTGSATDGSSPYDTLLLSGSTLYGTTALGGAHSDGTIFQIGTDGTGFNLLHSFAGGRMVTRPSARSCSRGTRYTE